MSQNNSGKPKADATQSSPEKRNKGVHASKGVKTPTHSRFGSQLMAIEQRMLFDGAFAVTADAIRPQTKEMADRQSRTFMTMPAKKPKNEPKAAFRALSVAIDRKSVV